MYYIVYDDVTGNSPDRISWTIMHEIGHIILGHLVEFSETALNRGGMTSKQYGVLEVEAHYFAAEFLMPTAILKYFTGITVDEIALLFGVSDKAAEKKYNRVFESIYRTWGIPWKTKYVPVCRKCPDFYSYIDDPKAQHCSYCGSIMERSEMYSNMFERMRARTEFVKIPGTRHYGYPYSDKLTVNGLQYTKVTVCPVFLNHEF